MAIIPGEQKLESSFVDPQKKKQKKMVYIFILVIVLIAAVLYFSFFRKEAAPSPADSTIGGTGEAKTFSSVDQQVKLIEAVSQIKLDNPLLKDKKFEALTSSGQFPLTIGEKGRANPFAGF